MTITQFPPITSLSGGASAGPTNAMMLILQSRVAGCGGIVVSPATFGSGLASSCAGHAVALLGCKLKRAMLFAAAVMAGIMLARRLSNRGIAARVNLARVRQKTCGGI
jgi:hypothetical protein